MKEIFEWIDNLNIHGDYYILGVVIALCAVVLWCHKDDFKE